MLVTGRIVNLDLKLDLLHILDAPVDVQDGGLVLFRERVIEVVGDEAGFTD